MTGNLDMEHNIGAEDRERLKKTHDLVIIVVVGIITFILSAYYDVLESIVDFAHQHEYWQLDEFITVMIVLVFVLTFYSIMRSRRLVALNRAIERKNEVLSKAFGEIKQLKGILPICASCKKIRDDKGYWHQVEMYVSTHTNAEFSHGLCPECIRNLYPDLDCDMNSSN
jgi:hypothetical protein